MGSPRYPLEAVVNVRGGERMRAEGQLAAALRAQARAERERAEAAAALASHGAAAPAAEAALAGRLSSGLQLQRAVAYAERRARTERELRAALGRADAALAQAQATARRAQAALAGAHGEEQVVLRDRARFQQAQRRAAERAEQDEQDGS
jgi:hypothetical protein